MMRAKMMAAGGAATKTKGSAAGGAKKKASAKGKMEMAMKDGKKVPAFLVKKNKK